MAASLPPPRLLPSGDSAVTVEFSRTIDDAANQRVLALDKALAASPIDGITESVPTYRSLLVHYDPGKIGFDALSEKLLPIASQPLRHEPCSMTSWAITGIVTRPAICASVATDVAKRRRATNQLLTAP